MKQAADAAPMSVVLDLGGTIRIGPRRIAVAELKGLLEAVATTGSVQGVAEWLGLSYRAAWARLKECEAAAGRPLVKKTRGHGTGLTEAGQALHEALGRASSALGSALARETRALSRSIADVLAQGARPLAFAVSHDLLLMEALVRLGHSDAAVVGSGEALTRLAQGRADAAGFHCGPREPARAGSPFAELMKNPAFMVRPLFMREQGLLLARGNPMGISSLADLAGRRVRYVNRQSGSGTRIWFDQMLAEAGLRASEVAGYELEEFTHYAVAAVIASGAADAGLAARSAAERFGLEFVPVGWETYYLASIATLPEDALDDLVAEVSVEASKTAGYRAPASD
jgi:molybdate transport repressor ModE-like protein